MIIYKPNPRDFIVILLSLIKGLNKDSSRRHRKNMHFHKPAIISFKKEEKIFVLIKR